MFSCHCYEICEGKGTVMTTRHLDKYFLTFKQSYLSRKPHFSFSFSIDIHLRYNNKKSCGKVSCCIVVSKRHVLLLDLWTQYKKSFNASYYIPRWCVSRGKWKPIANICFSRYFMPIMAKPARTWYFFSIAWCTFLKMSTYQSFVTQW